MVCLYTVALKRDNIRDKIKDKMIIQDKIGATVYYNPPVHKTPYYEKHDDFIRGKSSYQYKLG
ncbi:MAG: DegT/DnrJ/EryC1/StrS family aminotransferase [Thermoproteota archaeon]|nr:DegT/DnrJ/EryC1/StrS family aminotransferase [Thermoproteota archaeon]